MCQLETASICDILDLDLIEYFRKAMRAGLAKHASNYINT